MKLECKASPSKCSSLFLYWSQNFPSAINQREQYVIFFANVLLSYMHLHTDEMSEVFARREQKAVPLHRNLACPFAFLCLAISAAFSKADLQRCCHLPASRAAKGSPGASLSVGRLEVPEDAGERGLNIRWGRRTRRPCFPGPVNTEIRHPGSVPGFVLLSSFLNVDWF